MICQKADDISGGNQFHRTTIRHGNLHRIFAIVICLPKVGSNTDFFELLMHVILDVFCFAAANAGKSNAMSKAITTAMTTKTSVSVSARFR